VILRTTNGGTSWTAQTIPGITYLFGVDFTDASNGWAIGGAGYTPARGVILHTFDGGLHWHAQAVPSGIQWLSDVHFVNRCLGWAVGDNGAIVSTATGGWPDTTGPVTTAWSAAASYHGVATLRYRAWDVQSMKATVVLKVRNSNGRWVQAVALGARPTDTVLSYRLHTSLPRGTYRWFVFARDVSGHWQSRLGSASLAIR
jgi:hypothetical protein